MVPSGLRARPVGWFPPGISFSRVIVFVSMTWILPFSGLRLV